jgi:glutathione peroxidase-family protein
MEVIVISDDVASYAGRVAQLEKTFRDILLILETASRCKQSDSRASLAEVLDLLDTPDCHPFIVDN